MENVEKKPKSTKNTNAKDVEKKVSTSKASKANATTQERAVKSNASKQSASKRGAKTEPKQTDEVVKGQEVAVDTADVERNSSSDDFSIQSQGERIKKNAGKNSKRKKAAIAAAVVLLVTASVAIPTAVYLSRRKVSVDISNNIDIIQEYTVNVNRGSTIKDIVPQEIKGYTFVGFYKDAELTVPYKDTDKINKNMTIYAKYEANEYKVTFPTSPAFTIEGEDIVNNQVEIEYNSEYRFKLNLATGYDESDITVKVNGETVTPDKDGYYTLTIYGDTLVEVEGVKINTYDVTFYDSLDKNEMYLTLDIDYNQLCTYTGITPTKHSTHTYTYTFIGWVDAEGNDVDLSTTRIVTDLELFANFREEYIEYTITKPEQVNVKFGDLYLSNTATLHYGDIVEITYDTTEGHDVTAFSVSGAEKVEGSENQYKITGNLVVNYSEEIQKFTVQIESSNSEYGSINQSSITVDYGTRIAVDGNTLTIGVYTITATPTADDPTYDYVFVNWTNAVSEVTGDIIITANFTRETNTYTVSIQSNNTEYGTVTESSITVEYGTEITVSGNTITIGDTTITATPSISTAQYSYSFASWSTGNTTVTGEITITATFTQTVQTYTVTWQNWDGTTLETDTSVPYGTTPEYNGETPTREETASRRYTFTGWDQEINPVTGDITYTAIFDSEIKASYDFTIEDGTILCYTGAGGDVVIPSTYSLSEPTAVYDYKLGMGELELAMMGENERAFEILNYSPFGFYLIKDQKKILYTNLNEFIQMISNIVVNSPEEIDQIFQIELIYEYEVDSLDSMTTDTRLLALLDWTDTAGNTFSIETADGKTLSGLTKANYISEINALYSDSGNIDSAFPAKVSISPYMMQYAVPGDDYEVTTIGYSSFAYSNLVSIIIPNSIINIDDGAFAYCTSLTSITIPSGVTRIGSSAFASYNLVYVVNKSSVEFSVGDYGTRTDSILEIVSNESDMNLIEIDGNLYKDYNGERYFIRNLGGSNEIEIDSSCTQIYEYAFFDNADITSVSIPDSVTSIGSYAFEYCSSLENIIVDEGNTIYHSDGNCIIETGSKTLIAGCKTSIIPSDGSVTSIGSYAFRGCTSLTSITIGEGVTSIGNSAFEDCSSLTSITIPSSVTNIGRYAFSGCISLESIIVDEGNTVYHSDGNCIIETGSKTLIAGCKTSIIPSDGSVTSIGNYAFYGCSSLTSITIPESVTSIGSFAFQYCDNLTSITIGEGVTSIGEYAFNRCSSLTSVTIGDGVTSIGNYAFLNCISLTSITIPDSVTSIGDRAFQGCSSLTSVTIESNYAYANAGTGSDQCGYLLRYATEVRVLISCIEEGSTNSYLENANNFTKTTSEDGLYYIYTKN